MTIIANMGNIAKDKKLYFFLGIILISIIIFVGYILGFRIKENLMIGKMGTIEIKTSFPGTAIFIDESQKIVTTKLDEIVKVELSPVTHTLIISKEGYLPWMKKVSVPSNDKLVVNPVLINLNASGQIITKKDKDYYNIRNEIIKSNPANKLNPQISKDGTTKLWLEDNAILTESGSTTRLVIQPDTIIRNVSFYKDRPDVVMFSNRNSIYAIETEKEGTQNFLPIYKGEKPSFIMANDSAIYVLDGENLMQISI